MLSERKVLSRCSARCICHFQAVSTCAALLLVCAVQSVEGSFNSNLLGPDPFIRTPTKGRHGSVPPAGFGLDSFEDPLTQRDGRQASTATNESPSRCFRTGMREHNIQTNNPAARRSFFCEDDVKRASSRAHSQMRHAAGHWRTALRRGEPMARPSLRSPARRSLLQRIQDMFPTLSDGFGPWSSHFTNSIAICAVIRDENETDVREWLQYHKWLGVDHVYLTENNSILPIKEALRDFIASGFVTYATDDTPHAQLKVYRQCMGQYRALFNWMAFFDADEYLALRQKGVTLKQFLDGYRHFAGLGVHWITMGSSGRKVRPERGGVLRHYTQCQPDPHDHIKIIANTFFVRAIAQNPHTMFFRGRAAPVTEARQPIPYYNMSKVCTTAFCLAHPGHNQKHRELRTVNKIALFHYITKSLEDFKVKSRRGHGAGSAHKQMPFFDAVQRGQTDAPICKELAQLADACCPEASAASTE